MKRLPYRVHTASGDTIDIEFPLHENTEAPVQVSQLLSAILEAIDKEIKVTGPVANGDLLQAVAMALAVRSRMIYASSETTSVLASALTSDALKATKVAKISTVQHGHA